MSGKIAMKKKKCDPKMDHSTNIMELKVIEMIF